MYIIIFAGVLVHLRANAGILVTETGIMYSYVCVVHAFQIYELYCLQFINQVKKELQLLTTPFRYLTFWI